MNLQAPAYRPLDLSSIQPRGWLAQCLRRQAETLSGTLDTFWPDVRDSAWIGGEAEGWERMPYWLDGVVPLAWLVNDETLQARIHRYIDAILARQSDSGWLGPRPEQDCQTMDLWSQGLALKMLIGYYEATANKRVPGAIEKALRNLDFHISRHPLTYWAQFRWFEFLIALWWLYERKPQPWLIDLAVKLHAQGFNWSAFFKRWPITERTERGGWNFAGHVVNNAMALKAGALWWRLTGNKEERDAARHMLALLDKYHGVPTGVFSGDECLAGLQPTQGTELCAVVEMMYSLEQLILLTGDPGYAERLERITFNALPATLSPDMWSHQYVQQFNQIACVVRDTPPWTTNGPEANIFGVEPNFGCCTANFSQGWPKFAANLWMRDQEGSIACFTYAPSTAQFEVDDISVRIELTTDYPFGNELDFTVQVSEPLRLTLLLRIPTWAIDASINIDGEILSCQPGTLHRLERQWQGRSSFRLSLPRQIERTFQFRSVTLTYGPLVLALPVGEDWQRIHEDQPYRELPHTDWEIHPTAAWNYALVMPRELGTEKVSTSPCRDSDWPFHPDSSPLHAMVEARLLKNWRAVNRSAGEVPAVIASNDLDAKELIRLIPYGCTSLHIAAFPYVDS